MTREEAISAIAAANRARLSYCGLVSYEADAEVFVDNLIAIGLFQSTPRTVIHADDSHKPRCGTCCGLTSNPPDETGEIVCDNCLPCGDDPLCPGGVDPGFDECPRCGATMDEECRGIPVGQTLGSS